MHRLPACLIASLTLLACGCATPAQTRHFHVEPAVARLPAQDDLAPAIHDEAVRGGRSAGWTDSASPAEAWVRMSFLWSEDSGATPGKVRLVCRWSAADGRSGEATEGLAMYSHFWTASRAGDTAARICAGILRDLSPGAPGPAR